MKKIALLVVIIAGISLSACNEGTNPLERRGPKELAEWIYQKKTPALEQCGKIWVDQNNASKTELKNCEISAKNLAKIMTEGGFGNVKADHVKHPTIWMAFNDRIQASNANRYDPKRAAEAMRLLKKINKSRKEQEAEAREKALKALMPDSQ